MQRACTEAGLRSWCYEFGDPQSFTYMMLIVEEAGKFWLHDPWLDLSSDQDLVTLLDQIEAGGKVSLTAGPDSRTYLIDAKMEDARALRWLGKRVNAKRGSAMQVKGGMELLHNTAPAYRALIEASDVEDVSGLLLQPVALLNPDGLHDDIRPLAERLGLLPASTQGGRGASRQVSQSLLTNRTQDALELARSAQVQLASMLDQLVAERRDLTQELSALRGQHSDLQIELATLKESTRGELLRAAQARMAAEQEAQQTGARLAQMKAEADDAHANALRIQDLLNNSEGETRRLLEALDASEAERQRIEAPVIAAEALSASFAGSAPRSILGDMILGAAATVGTGGQLTARGRKGGCICYGPYLNLAGGSYCLEIDWFRPALAGLLPSRGVIEVVDGDRFLYSQKFKLGAGNTRLKINFDIAASKQKREVEFRVMVGRNSFATLGEIRLEAKG